MFSVNHKTKHRKTTYDEYAVRFQKDNGIWFGKSGFIGFSYDDWDSKPENCFSNYLCNSYKMPHSKEGYFTGGKTQAFTITEMEVFEINGLE